MNLQDFLEAVKKMVGLPPDMVAQLVTLGPSLSDADRAAAIQGLSAEHTEIAKEQDEILKMVHQGNQLFDADERVMRTSEHQAEEERERKAADSMLDDDDSTPAA